MLLNLMTLPFGIQYDKLISRPQGRYPKLEAHELQLSSAPYSTVASDDVNQTANYIKPKCANESILAY
jgi:hypothetical protein